MQNFTVYDHSLYDLNLGTAAGWKALTNPRSYAGPKVS